MDNRADLGTIWEVPDDLWAEIKKVLDEVDPDPKGRRGRPRIDPRRALDGIIFRMRSSCQWNHLPKSFGDDSSVHRTFQRWVDKGVFVKVWALLAKRCDEKGAVEWDWQAADGFMGKARSGGTSLAPILPTGRSLGARRASSSTARAAR